MPQPPVPIVGIGASAGGLPALEALFLNMPADTGLAFVIVTYLPSGRTSALPFFFRFSYCRAAIRPTFPKRDWPLLTFRIASSRFLKSLPWSSTFAPRACDGCDVIF
jgi:hypothetical protein